MRKNLDAFEDGEAEGLTSRWTIIERAFEEGVLLFWVPQFAVGLRSCGWRILWTRTTPYFRVIFFVADIAGITFIGANAADAHGD